MPQTTTSIRAGIFCWPELCSANTTESKKFYGSLFGWSCEDQHMPGGDYTLLKLHGENVGAMYQMADDRKSAGVLPHWNSYVSVKSVDEAAKKTAELEGKILTEPFDAGKDRLANLQDPTGVNFSVWQINEESDHLRLNEMHSLVWTELLTREPEKASKFYSGLFGWRATPFEGGPVPYTVFNVDGEDKGIGGMYVMTSEMPGSPHWLIYFRVENTDKIIESVTGLGGKKLHGPMDIPNIGRIAVLADPQGADFAVIQVAENSNM